MEFHEIFKVVVVTRQPSEDKEFWHSEILKLKSGEVVSGAGADEDDEEDEDENYNDEEEGKSVEYSYY